MNKKVSIIIPNFNGASLIKECVDYIEKQTYEDYEIIVVDDGSQDNSVEIIKKLPVYLIENKQNLGFAASVNRGITESKGDYILLLNNDVFITDPKFLNSMVNTIELNSKIFSVSPKMIRYKEPEYLDDTGDNYTCFGWVYKRGDGDPVDTYNSDSIVFSTCAGAGLYRKTILDQIGYLDESHFAYLEDVDLGWRAQIYGYYNIYSSKSKCYHVGSATFAKGNKYSNQKVYLSARNNIYIIAKNMPPFQILANLPYLIVGFGTKIIYFSIKGYGKAYRKGLLEGFKNMHTLKKVSFKEDHFDNYLRIQKEMIEDTVFYLELKFKQLSIKLKRKLIKQNPRNLLKNN